MSELKSRMDIANEYFKCQQVSDYQKAFEEMKSRCSARDQETEEHPVRNRKSGEGACCRVTKDQGGEDYLAKDNKSKKGSCCRIL